MIIIIVVIIVTLTVNDNCIGLPEAGAPLNKATRKSTAVLLFETPEVFTESLDES